MEIDWISAKDGTPQKDGRYLAVIAGYAFKNPYIKIIYFMNDLKIHPEFRYYEEVKSGQSGWWDGDSEGDWLVNDVLYWMPLPEAPEVVSNEKK